MRIHRPALAEARARMLRQAHVQMLMLMLVLVMAAGPLAAHANATPSGEAELRAFLLRGARSDADLWDIARWQASLLAIYQRSGVAPVWSRQGTVTTQAEALIGELVEADRRGLRPDYYAGGRLAALARRAASMRVEERLQLDVLMSVNALRLASDLHAGRVAPRALGYDLDVPHARLDAEATLEALESAQDLSAELDALEPDLRHYDLLKAALARYQELARHPRLNRLPALGRRSIKPGEAYEGASQLRALLRALGDLTDSEVQRSIEAQQLLNESILDSPLAAALERFQRRHGLDVDGVLGRRTFAALTTPLEQRALQIELSMERARWLPPKLATPPLIVNIPQFRLFAFRTTEDAARDTLQMSVIVGSSFPGRRTPVFAADLRYIVLKPYWDVPRSILRDELLPRIRADARWIERNGFEIVNGPGDDAEPVQQTPQSVDRLASGALRLRQKPGPDNALGNVKFMLPNRHNVYLHDTPARALFARTRRDFSHGCIRVEDPMALLDHLLRGRSDWTLARAREAIASGGPSQRIDLDEPVRVFILYATALATEAGETLFFDDLYGHDMRLAALLAGRRGPRAAQAGI